MDPRAASCRGCRGGRGGRAPAPRPVPAAERHARGPSPAPLIGPTPHPALPPPPPRYNSMLYGGPISTIANVTFDTRAPPASFSSSEVATLFFR